MQILHGILNHDISNEVSGTVEFTYSYYGNNYTILTPLNSKTAVCGSEMDNKVP